MFVKMCQIHTFDIVVFQFLLKVLVLWVLLLGCEMWPIDLAFAIDSLFCAKIIDKSLSKQRMNEMYWKKSISMMML